MGYRGKFGCNTFSLIGDDGVSSYLRNRMIPGGSYKGFGIAAQSKSRQGVSYNLGKRPLGLEDCISRGTFEIGGDVYLLPPEELAAKYIAICGYCGQFSLSQHQSIREHQSDPGLLSVTVPQSVTEPPSVTEGANIRLGLEDDCSQCDSSNSIENNLVARTNSDNRNTNKGKSKDHFNEELKFLVDNGYLTIEGDIATLTKKGFRYYGAVLSMFYPVKG